MSETSLEVHCSEKHPIIEFKNPVSCNINVRLTIEIIFYETLFIPSEI